MIFGTKLSNWLLIPLPRSVSKAINWFGFFTIFDFFLITIIDFADQNTENGDAFKLYNYFSTASESGIIGYFITFMIELVPIVITIFLFYYHIVFVHHESKIADIYLRITGKIRNYFIPEDNELSYRYLKHQYIEGELNNNRILANKIEIWDNIDKMDWTAKLIHFYQFSKWLLAFSFDHRVYFL